MWECRLSSLEAADECVIVCVCVCYGGEGVGRLGPANRITEAGSTPV